MTTRENKRVVLVTGAPRSGTAALASLLNCHPKVAIGYERYSRRVQNGTLSVADFETSRMREFHEEDGNPLSFKISCDRQVISKLDGASVVGDKVPYPGLVIDAARRMGGVPVIAVIREPIGMAHSFEARRRRAVNGSNAERELWPIAHDYKVATDQFNAYVKLLHEISRSRWTTSPPLLVLEYSSLFAGHYPVERIFEFVGLDAAECVGLDTVLGARNPEAAKVDQIYQHVATHADYSGYRDLLARFGVARKDA